MATFWICAALKELPKRWVRLYIYVWPRNQLGTVSHPSSEVLKEGSLSGAARALDIAQPTVGRHIAALEKSLGLALFIRSQTGLMPTEAAQSLRGFAESMQSTAASLERAAASQGAGVRGTVRVTSSDVIGVEVLPPIVTALRDQYPELTVELVLTNRVQDLSAQRGGHCRSHGAAPTGIAGRTARRPDQVGATCAPDVSGPGMARRQHCRFGRAFAHRF